MVGHPNPSLHQSRHYSNANTEPLVGLSFTGVLFSTKPERQKIHAVKGVEGDQTVNGTYLDIP